MNRALGIVGALIATMGVSTTACAEPAVRRVPAYDLRVPSTVSRELQGAMAKAPPSVAPPSMPTTNAGWERFFNPDPARTHARISALLARFRLVMTEETIDGVHCYRIV
ncbi:MAG: hypothetical protein ACREEG_07065, partial [Phenylobacterium sp.]